MSIAGVGFSSGLSSVKSTFTKEQLDYLDQIEQDNKTNTLSLNQDMGRDQFLHILLTQLSNQNPLDPLQDKDFIAQMAQFSSLESMQALNKTFEGVQEDIGSIKTLISQMQSSQLSTGKAQNDELVNELKLINENMTYLNEINLAQLNLLMNQNQANQAYE